MKVLIACEESQAVCIEFRKLGFEACSCDIINCSGGHPEWHIKDDVLNNLTGWDLIIAFPPCTHLAVSGAKHFAKKIADGRQQAGIDFFMSMVNAPCERIVIENPIGIMSSLYRKPDQIIQPWQFGDPFQKTTCLWLKNMPLLKHTDIVDKGDFYITPTGKNMASWMCDPIGENGKKLGYNTDEIKKMRSKTFPGIAKAMAEQYTNHIINNFKTTIF